MLDAIKNFLRIGAATQLPPVAPPKRLSNRQVGAPSYLKTAKPSESSQLPLNDRKLVNKDLTTYRTGTDTNTVVRDLAASHPDMSTAVATALRTAITSSFTAVARNMDGSINADATSVLHQIISRMDVLSDYTAGYADRNSLRSNSEQLGKELMLYGAAGLELVLDKTRLPERVQPISTTQIVFYPSDNGTRLSPKQKLSGEFIDLDIPTFFYVSLDQNLLEPYAESPLQSAIQPVLFSMEMQNDLRRIVRKAINPRVDVIIDEEKIRKSLPQDVLMDQEKLTEFLNTMIAGIEEKVNGLNPEDALVHFDSIGFGVMDKGNTSLSSEWDSLQKIANSKMATGTRTMATILGHGAASANIASAESLVYLKQVDGAIREKLNELYSRVFTLATRLYGFDVYVEFAYAPIDLRPQNELEAFSAMKQSRVLELLSLGMITDEEAAIELTGHLPPPGYTPKSGTMFRPNTGTQPAGDGYNGATNSGSTMNQNLNPDTPKNAKSQNGGKKGN